MGRSTSLPGPQPHCRLSLVSCILDEELALLETISAETPELSTWLSLEPLDLDLPAACEFLLELREPLESHDRTLVRLIGENLNLAESAPPAVSWEITELEEHDWLDLDGTVTVGGQQLPLAVLIQALRFGQRYLVAGGQYVDLDTEPMQQLCALLEAAAALPDEERVRVSRHDLDTWEEFASLDGLEADAEQRCTLLRGIRPVDLSEEALDEAVHAALRPYQLEGYRWLSARWDAGLGGVLADDMGLGKTLQLLRRRIAPLLLRRTKDLVARDLPPKLETTLSLQLQPAQVTRYTTALNKERQRVLGLLDEPARNRVEILAALTRLRLLATDPGTVEAPSAKARELADRIEELAGSGHRALVFSQFTSHLRIIRRILEHRGITTAYLDGSTPAREMVIDGFRTGDQQAFLISLKAGGSGLTLVEADYVFILDPWWNPAVEEQAIDRTHRIGQDSTVTVYRLVSAQTIEEKVLALQETKRALISSVMDPDAGVTTALDAARIRELIDV